MTTLEKLKLRREDRKLTDVIKLVTFPLYALIVYEIAKIIIERG